VNALASAAQAPAPRAAPGNPNTPGNRPVSGNRPAPAARPLRLLPPVADQADSALLDQLARAASAAGCLVRRAAPAPAERDLPFGVMRALLEAPLRAVAAAERAALLASAAGPAVALLLGAADRDGPSDIVMAHSFLWLAAGLGARRPLALIVDDAQWSDAASLEALAYLARRIDDVPVLLAVAPGPGAELPSNLREAVGRRALTRRRRAAERALRAAELLLAENRFEQAYVLACQAGVDAEPNGWGSTAALALAHLARYAEASTLAGAELAAARSSRAPQRIARALVARVVSEPHQAARAQLAADALEELANRPPGLESIRLRLELGSALTRIGHRVEAREPLRIALAEADRVGARALAERARRELVATGLRPRRAATRGAAALTPRQRQICELAAAGKANRAIAAELFLSGKTVETHLVAAYRKLGITTRRELMGRI
jgi:DNA-binding CsgD family transcriptional regulator